MGHRFMVGATISTLGLDVDLLNVFLDGLHSLVSGLTFPLPNSCLLDAHINTVTTGGGRPHHTNTPSSPLSLSPSLTHIHTRLVSMVSR
jgi:hypothetical protein